MKIVFLIESLFPAGAERVVMELARSSDGWECEAQIIALRESPPPGGLYGGINVQTLFRDGGFRWPKSAPTAALRLRKLLAKIQPDLLAIHTPKAAVTAALADVRVPTLWVLHGHDVCWDGTTTRRRLSRALQRWAQRRLGGRVAAVSGSLADHAAEGLGIAREMIAVIPNGVDTGRFRFVEKVPNGDPVVCVLGRLVPWKGPMQALDAFGLLREKIPAARLWFVGDGPMREKLAAETSARGWNGAVKLWGMLQEPEQALSQASVLWMPSESEGLPVACVEAMASGVPVIGFDVEGVRDLLGDGCGVLVPPNDARMLAEETAALLSDGERYRRIARAARARVERHYSLEGMCAAHYALMRTMITRGTAREAYVRAVAELGAERGANLEEGRNG